MVPPITTIGRMRLERGISLVNRRMVSIVAVAISIHGTPVLTEIAGLHLLKSPSIMRLIVTLTVKSILKRVLIVVLMIHAVRRALVIIHIMLVAQVV